MKATLRIPLPPTLNDQIRANRGNKYLANKTKQQWSEIVGQACYYQELPSFTNNVWVLTDFYLKNFNRDPDNIEASLKYVFDAIQEYCGHNSDQPIITNDNLKVIQSPKISYFHRSKTKEDYLELSLYDNQSELMIEINNRFVNEHEKAA